MRFKAVTLAALLALGCTSGSDPASEAPEAVAPNGEPGPPPERATASVVVNLAARGSSVGPAAFGLHTSVYDNALHEPTLPELLGAAGITALRYPGGGYADNYHWSRHQMTAWADGSRGYLGPSTDFGSYVSAVQAMGAAILVTVNYGSNLAGTGPGEPKEAAAWVAYANGEPGDETPIGLDAAGNDWKTVGYWAALRASTAAPSDDGYNFLRIGRAAPIGVEYWEIGNEVFGNGYYAGRSFELDLHVPNQGVDRTNHPDLSPARYGRGVRDYALEMKAVDPTIKVGAVLNTPPNDYNWGPTWNADVLSECGRDIDFGIVHLYAGRNAAGLLRVPTARIPAMLTELRASFAAAAGEHAPNIEIALTEIGPRPGFPESDLPVSGIFAADAYVSLMEQGVVNIDWLELHNASFLAESTQAKGPAYHGIQMAHRLVSPGDTFLSAETTTQGEDGGFAAHAAQRQDRSISVMLVNRSAVTTLQTQIDIPGATFAQPALHYDYALVDGAGAASESREVRGLSDSFSLELPPYSVTVVVLPLERTP